MASDVFVPHTIRIILFVVAVLTAGAAHADKDCAAGNLPAVSPTAKALLPAQFAGITSDMPTVAILKRLGPAARDIGSGLFVLEWDVTDGRTFVISTAGTCEEKPFSVGFRHAKRAPDRGAARPLSDQQR